MLLVCVSTGRNLWLSDWERSARHHGCEPTVLGLALFQWEGFRTYIDLLMRSLSEINPHELVCITDAYDVIFAAGPSEITEKYYQRGALIMVSAEAPCASQNCRPHGADGINHPVYRHINSGVLIGPARALLEMYQWIQQLDPDDFAGSEQIGVALYKAAHPGVVGLDGQQAVTATLASCDDMTPVADRRFRHTVTHSSPCIIHTPNMHLDLGKRSSIVRHHALPHYRGVPPLMHFYGLYHHVKRFSVGDTRVTGYAALFWSIRIALWVGLAFVLVGLPYLIVRKKSRLWAGLAGHVLLVGVLTFGIVMLLLKPMIHDDARN